MWKCATHSATANFIVSRDLQKLFFSNFNIVFKIWKIRYFGSNVNMILTLLEGLIHEEFDLNMILYSNPMWLSKCMWLIKGHLGARELSQSCDRKRNACLMSEMTRCIADLITDEDNWKKKKKKKILFHVTIRWPALIYVLLCSKE